jgi:3-oxoacyl-[acyl-carrier protein] reductase
MKSNEEELLSLPSDRRLAGQTALVTGSSSGIGEAVARVLAASGARVIVSGRNAERTHGVVTTIERGGGRASALVGDLATSASEVRRFGDRAMSLAGGRIDILVNNAGIYPATATAELGDDDLDDVLAINIRAPHVLVATLAPAMAERGSGSVVNIGSWMARVGLPFGAMYTASKAALEQMTRTWAAEYGPRGVSVNTVAPGATSTPGNAESADVLAAMTAVTVAGRPVRPVDVAYAVRFVVSAEARFLSGSVVDVDGGIAHTRLG